MTDLEFEVRLQNHPDRWVWIPYKNAVGTDFIEKYIEEHELRTLVQPTRRRRRG